MLPACSRDVTRCSNKLEACSTLEILKTKTYKHLFEKVCSFDNLYTAYIKARKGKRFKLDVDSFSYNLEHELIQLEKDLLDGSYQSGEYHQFMIHEPKERLISAAPFRDRVVHHAIYQVIEPINDKKHIHDVKRQIDEFLQTLRLKLHPKKSNVFPVRIGTDFLGYRIYPTHSRIRRANVKRFIARTKRLQWEYANGDITMENVRSSIHSWLGHAKHADSYRLRSQLLKRFSFSRTCFQLVQM